MTIDWISLISGGALIGVLKLTWDIIKYFKDKKDKRNKALKEFADKQGKMEALFNDLITSAVNIQELLEGFVEEHDITRVSLMKMENGGGIPQLGTVQHISILNEAINQKFEIENEDVESRVKPIKQDFQHYIIGNEYQKLMKMVFSEKDDIALMYTDNMEDGVLKQVYKAQGINSFIMVPIVLIPSLPDGLTRGFLIYMSIEFSEKRTLNSSLKSDYIILRQKIKHIFQEFYVERITAFE